MKVIPETHRAN